MGLFDFLSSKPQPTQNSASQSRAGQAITHLNSENFDSFVTGSPTPVLVDFWADWCGPCKQITPMLNDIARDYAGQITISKVNVDHFGDIAARFNVMSIPTMILFRNGREANRIVGAMPKERLLRELSLAPLTAPIATTAPTQRSFPFETLLARQPTPDSVPGTEQWMDLLRKVVPYQSLTKAIFYYNRGFVSGARNLLTTLQTHNYNNPDLQSAIAALLKRTEGASDRPGANQIAALQAGNREQMPYSAVLWAVENGHTDKDVVTAIRVLLALQGV